MCAARDKKYVDIRPRVRAAGARLQPYGVVYQKVKYTQKALIHRGPRVFIILYKCNKKKIRPDGTE